MDISIGQSFGRLTVVEKLGLIPSSLNDRFTCICTCGAKKDFRGASLAYGYTRSCGCLRREISRQRATKDGRCSNPALFPLYRAWQGMVKRCNNPNDTGYKNYGGRGIRVCDRWMKFENFYADMGDRPSGKSLDRYPNNNGNYEPGNCRWATSLEQMNNIRDNIFMVINGESKSIAEWSRELGVNRQTLYKRWYKKMRAERFSIHGDLRRREFKER